VGINRFNLKEKDMKKFYNLKKGQWDNNELVPAYSPACFDRANFRQEDNCLVNREGKSLFGYEYISLTEKVKRKMGVVATLQCSFEKFGAPLIVFSNDLPVNEKGERIYGEHYEIVAYEKGINIWKVIPWPERVERPTKSILLAKKEFAIEGNSMIEIKMEILEDKIKSWVNGEYLETEVEGLPTEFWVGFTACEGINRFYTFEVED
jgi:hypothetical protein